jgi:hypothetical protein
MTIDRRLWLAIPIVLLGWIAVLALVMRLSGQAPAALVLFPSASFFKALPAGSAITAIGPYSVTLKGGAGLVAALYLAGAPLVLPAGLTGCLPQAAI